MKAALRTSISREPENLTCKGREVEMRTYLLESAVRSLHRFYDSVDPAKTDLRQQLCTIAIRLEQVRRQLATEHRSQEIEE
jgi:hypothetical protein